MLSSEKWRDILPFNLRRGEQVQPWACALCISGPKAFVFQQQVFTLTILSMERKLKTAALQRFVKKGDF